MIECICKIGAIFFLHTSLESKEGYCLGRAIFLAEVYLSSALIPSTLKISVPILG